MMTEETTEEDAERRDPLSPRDQRRVVRDRYGTIADGKTVDKSRNDESANGDSSGCCGGSEAMTSSEPVAESAASSASSCCGDETSSARAQTLGYSPADLESVPDTANLGLGCGNPKALAELEPGETVLDLGSGGGFDCFLAAEEVGSEGHVIGVDMTPEMVERARSDVERMGIENVEFRLGKIEALPVPDEHVDVVISNCVINLSPWKARVFEEAYRVLEPGGQMAISDIAVRPNGRSSLDQTDPDQLASCIAGAATPGELRVMAEDAGFESVSVGGTGRSDEVIRDMVEESELRDVLLAVTIEGGKPNQ